MPGGETTDALVVWLPDSRTLFTGNLTGPLFGHVPNLVTMRGDRYRDALTYVASLDARPRPRRRAAHHRALRPDRRGRSRSIGELTAMRDAMQWVHDRTVDGMNAGTDVHTLMREIVVPAELDLGEGYGTDAPGTSGPSGRTTPAGSTTDPRPSCTTCHPWRWPPDIVAAAGADALLDAARGPPRRRSTPSRRSTSPTSSSRRHPATTAPARWRWTPTRPLLASSTNFWETAWLQRSADKLGAARVNTATFDFTGAAVLVTGGTSGIGHAVATTFADAGADVTITGTRPAADEYDTELEPVHLPAARRHRSQRRSTCSRPRSTGSTCS